MAQINDLLDESIAADGFVIRERRTAGSGPATIDLSAIDFEALAKRFDEGAAQERRAGAAQGGDPRPAGAAGPRRTAPAPTTWRSSRS